MKLVVFLLLQCLSINAFAAWQSTELIEVAKTRNVKATHGTHIRFDISTLLKSGKKVDGDSRIAIDLEIDKRIYLDVKSLKYGKSSDDFSWFGKVNGESGEAILSVRHGKLAGTIYTDDGTYSIVPFEGHYIVTKQDQSRKLSFKNDAVLEKPLKKIDSSGSSYNQGLIRYKERAETLSVVDVLVLYTASLKNKYGENTIAMVQNVFDIADNAYLNSNTFVNLNLVSMQQLPVNSTLNNDADLSILLDNLEIDGYAAHLRRTHNADMVVVVGAFVAQDYCGLAVKPYNLASSMTNAFATVLMKPSNEGGDFCSDLTFAHELGHNFSCNHDRDNTESDTNGHTMYSYGFGYDTAEFATIMSYKENEISYFSNPSINHNSVAVGVANSEDNARVIRNTRAKIADNSDEIDESLEAGDTVSGLNIDGYLEANTDRDGYESVNLGGSTTFNGDNVGFTYWYFFISLYNSDYELVAQFDGCDADGNNCSNSVVANIPNGEYRVVIGRGGPNYTWNGDTADYEIGIVTDYTPPVNTSCIYAVSSLESHFSKSGGSQSVTVTGSPNDCIGSWRASESLEWITLSGDTQGSGSGSWSTNYTVSPANGGRIGTFNVAGSEHKVNQIGLAIVYDERTKVYWQDEEYTSLEDNAYNNGQAESGKVKYWDTAVSYCKDLNYAGYDDWRLPTKTELQSVVNMSNAPKIESAFYYKKDKYFWSSTLDPADATKAYTLNYATGNLAIQTKDAYVHYIRCVRKLSANPSIIMYLLN